MFTRCLKASTLVCALMLVSFGAQAADPVDSSRQVSFREPRLTSYTFTVPEGKLSAQGLAPNGRSSWIEARQGSSNRVEIGNRLVLQADAKILNDLIAGRGLELSRTVASNLFILQARDSLAAIDAAEALSADSRVTACYPVMRRSFRKRNAYAKRPKDPYYQDQWHLENRGMDNKAAGADLNVRAAWALSRGENVIVGIGDDGVQLDHPDLKLHTQSGPHYNFFEGISNGGPGSTEAIHSTSVAGLIAADTGNSTGVAGVAPGSSLASWVIFGISPFGFETIATDEQLMDMFQYASNSVAVQNHSWGGSDITQQSIETLSNAGIGNAVTKGRGGKGVVMVRACGNERLDLHNANDDGLAADPRVIAVAAVRNTGRVCTYSSPGACVLVAAPSGDLLADDAPPGTVAEGVLTTDLTGAEGYSSAAGDAADYTLFDGTSASAPQIAGVAALILGANPDLTYRDVQQIFILSSRHFDFADPDLRTNGGGFLVSHNLGFGVPDAGQAVVLAKTWRTRPAPQRISFTNAVVREIPDDSLRLICSGPEVTPALGNIRCLPSEGPHPDVATQDLPLVYVGQANSDLTIDLHGKGALIQRGTSFFSDKITRAAKAGAAFAVIFNNIGTTEIQPMGGTEFVPIPAISIGRLDGEALRDLALSSNLTAHVQLSPAIYSFPVEQTLSCEHVGLRLKTTHRSRSDVRVTLLSPMGTRSVLQKINADDSRGPTDWTYWSTHHFYESSAGTWRLEISDERDTTVQNASGSTSPATGSVTYAELIIQGTTLTDTDRDGLDDPWEMAQFGNLDRGPRDDVDGDGWINSREQIMGSDAARSNKILTIDIAELAPGYMRLSWPARDGASYEIMNAGALDGPLSQPGTEPGHFPITEFIVPSGAPAGFFTVKETGATPGAGQ